MKLFGQEMTWRGWVTLSIMLTTTLIWLVWDLYVVLTHPALNETESEVIQIITYFGDLYMIPYVLGVLCGHFFIRPNSFPIDKLHHRTSNLLTLCFSILTFQGIHILFSYYDFAILLLIPLFLGIPMGWFAFPLKVRGSK